MNINLNTNNSTLINCDNPSYIEEAKIKNMPYDLIITINNEINLSSEISLVESAFTKGLYNESDNLEKIDEEIQIQKDACNTIFTKYNEYSNNIPTSNFKYSIGNGNFEYINDNLDKVMFENAWQAITQTNMWGFIKQPIDSFVFSTDSPIEIISEKMEELGYNVHSSSSFGLTMRNMQYLAQYGEDNFKKMCKDTHNYEELNDDIYPCEKVMEYEKKIKELIKRRVNKIKIYNNILEYMGGY